MPQYRVSYRTLEIGSQDIHLRTLRDNQQYADDLGAATALGISSATWSLFGIIWDSSQVLAHLMSDFDIQGKRILEVGCGIGLSSLLLNGRNADITATDYHPEAESFLIKNTALNRNKPIPFVRTGWADSESRLGNFDLIIGSDLLYEPNHTALLSQFIHRHANTACEIIIIDPGRQQCGQFTRAMTLLGYTHSRSKPETSDYLSPPFRGQVLVYRRGCLGC